MRQCLILARMVGRSLGHRAPLLWLVLPFIAGLVVAKTASSQLTGWPLALSTLFAITALVAIRRAPRCWAPALLASMFLAGIAGYALHRARLSHWDALPSREAKLSFKVERVFVQTDARRATGIATIVTAENHIRELQGQTVYFAIALGRGQKPCVRSA